LHGRRGIVSILDVRHADYASEQSESFVLAGSGAEERTVRLGAGGKIVVQTRTVDGDAVMGVRVEDSRTHEWQLTDERGNCTFSRVSTGEHRFEAKTASGQARGDVQVVHGNEYTLTLTVRARARLSGRITEGGQSLSGATLQLRCSDGQPYDARTNGQGEYTIPAVEVGSYGASILHPTRAMAFKSEVDVLGAESRFDVDLPVTIIEGRTLDEEGRPLAGVRVRVTEDKGPDETTFLPGQARVFSGPDGRFVLRGVRTGTEVVVRAESPDHQLAQSAPLTLAPGGARSGVDLTLAPGPLLVVSVSHVDGAPASNCRVRLQDDAANSVTGITNAEGMVRFPGLKLGQWRIHVTPDDALRGNDGLDAQEGTIVIQPRQANVAEFQLP
jgi:hypothetical protein